MAVYLLTLLTKVFKLTPQDAGFRTAGFVVQATALRPVGGVLADLSSRCSAASTSFAPLRPASSLWHLRDRLAHRSGLRSA